MQFKNPEKVKGRFINPHISDLKRTLFDFVLWRSGYYDESRSCEEPPRDFFYPSEPAPFDPCRPAATWLGHSTYLFRFRAALF